MFSPDSPRHCLVTIFIGHPPPSAPLSSRHHRADISALRNCSPDRQTIPSRGQLPDLWLSPWSADVSEKSHVLPDLLASPASAARVEINKCHASQQLAL
jgi:hypothetical protein